MPFPSPRIEPRSPALKAESSPLSYQGSPGWLSRVAIFNAPRAAVGPLQCSFSCSTCLLKACCSQDFENPLRSVPVSERGGNRFWSGGRVWQEMDGALAAWCLAGPGGRGAAWGQRGHGRGCPAQARTMARSGEWSLRLGLSVSEGRVSHLGWY